MDPFQIRMDFMDLLKRLNASQQSIHKVLAFAMRHATKAADDLWDCIIAECARTSLNARLNILFLLDAMLTDDSSGLSSPALAAITYGPLARRDLRSLILESVVPNRNWDGIKLNAGSVQQILASWRTKRLFDAEMIEDINVELDRRKEELQALPPSERVKSSKGRLSKNEIIRRIEEDRERHKRLRERIWILPPRSFADAIPPRINLAAIATPSGVSLNSPASSGPGSSLSNLTSPASPREGNLPSSKDILQTIGIGPGSSRSAVPSSSAASDPRSGLPANAVKNGLPPRKRRRDEGGSTALLEGAVDADIFHTELATSAATRAASRDLDPSNIEFEDAWETTSDLNEDDLEFIAEEDSRWWGGKQAISTMFGGPVKDELLSNAPRSANDYHMSTYRNERHIEATDQGHGWTNTSRQHGHTFTSRSNGRLLSENANGTVEKGLWRSSGRGGEGWRESNVP